MEYVKENLRLAPLAGTGQIDANRNPYELLNNLVNVAPLGTITTGHPPFLLQVPESSNNRPSFTHRFFQESSILNMMITFPRPILLSEVQVLCKGGKRSKLPAHMDIRVCESVHEGDIRKYYPGNYSILIDHLRGYIWIQLEDATLVQGVSLLIRKPAGSRVVYLKQIRILEQIQEYLNLDTLRNRITESIIGFSHLTKYCWSALKDLRSSKTLLVRVIAVLSHFGGKVSNEDKAKLMGTLIDRVLETTFHTYAESVPRGLRNFLISLSNILSENSILELLEGAHSFLRALFLALRSQVVAGSLSREMESILTPELLLDLYKWSMKLKSVGKSEQKINVHLLMGCVCHCKPSLFLWLMYSMDLLQIQEETNLDGFDFDLMEKWFNEDSVWTKLEPNQFLLSMDLSGLEILGMCAQSSACAKILKESSLLESLRSAIFDYCKSYGRVGDNRIKTIGEFEKILRFFRSLGWFGATRDFWFPVLNFFSVPPRDFKSEMEGVESAMIDLLESLCWGPSGDREKIFPALRQVISKEDKLSPFCLELLGKLLVDDELPFPFPTRYPSNLEMFSRDGGLLLMFQRINSNIWIGISADVIHSLRHFLDLPLFTEVIFNEIFWHRTHSLIRVVLDPAYEVYGNRMLSSSIVKTLETLPFEAVNWLLERSPLGQGEILRRKMVDSKAIDFVLDCFDRLRQSRAPVHSSQKDDDDSDYDYDSYYDDDSDYDDDYDSDGYDDDTGDNDHDENYVQESSEKREIKMIWLLNLLTNFVTLPHSIDPLAEEQRKVSQTEVFLLLDKSSVMNRVSDNLKNDSVLDIANHVSLYKVILRLVRAIAAASELRPLLASDNGDLTIYELLLKMKTTVVQYSQVLDASNIKDFGFANLVEDMYATVARVEECQKGSEWSSSSEKAKNENVELARLAPLKSLEEIYVEEMRNIQFEFIEMITDGQDFKVPFHFESEAHRNWSESGVPSRPRRLAREATSLSKSLPLSYGSSIFLRIDNDRLDVIKVLITGAEATPYANGCFEFDVYFPLDYPNSPAKVNFVTTKGIRFAPHIYTDGQICLTLLNTWDGSKEEMWDPKTSSLLPVLVAIQSVILSEDPEESQDFYDNARYYTLQHAMLEQIRRPPKCWEEVINRHFWLKREEILAQCEQWIEWSQEMDLESQNSFKETVDSFKYSLLKISRPKGLKQKRI